VVATVGASPTVGPCPPPATTRTTPPASRRGRASRAYRNSAQMPRSLPGSPANPSWPPLTFHPPGQRLP